MSTAERVLDGVRDLLPVLRERAQETEDARRIPDASMKSLQETGFFKLLQPARHGGIEADPVAFYTA
ncbi:MAG TPA: flavin-dependent monooxygenase, partial [Pseudonocardiaceae bacterium]|nr:flavin-dependent monooxygenase [Pseudonocardiaceae bacterium]